MKKLFSLILAGLMTLSLAACGGSSSTGGSAQASKDNKVLYSNAILYYNVTAK